MKFLLNLLIVITFFAPKAFGQQTHSIDSFLKNTYLELSNEKKDSRTSGLSLFTGRAIESAGGDIYVVDGCTQSIDKDPGCHADVIPTANGGIAIALGKDQITCPAVNSPAYIKNGWGNVQEGEMYCVKTRDGGYYGIIQVDKFLPNRAGIKIQLLLVGRANLGTFGQSPNQRRP